MMFKRWCAGFVIFMLAMTAAWAEENSIASLNWQVGPRSVGVAGKATLDLMQGYGFLDAKETDRFLQLTENLPTGRDQVLMPLNGGWWASFEFDAVGYVKDDEQIDAAAVLESVRQGTEAGNEERRKRGWGTLTIQGWQFSPKYDSITRRLEWAILAREDRTGEPVVNYNTRILGRTGVMRVLLVASPQNLPQAVAELNGVLDRFAYIDGEKYTEFRQGDRVAEFGLAALIAGGAAAVATKNGFWAALLAGGKWIWVAVAGAFAWVSGWFRKK